MEQCTRGAIYKRQCTREAMYKRLSSTLEFAISWNLIGHDCSTAFLLLFSVANLPWNVCCTNFISKVSFRLRFLNFKVKVYLHIEILSCVTLFAPFLIACIYWCLCCFCISAMSRNLIRKGCSGRVF